MEEMTLVVASHPSAESLQFLLSSTDDPQDHVAEFHRELLEHRPGFPVEEWDINAFGSTVVPVQNEDEDLRSPAAKRPPVSPSQSNIDNISANLESCSPFKGVCNSRPGKQSLFQCDEDDDADDNDCLATQLAPFDDDKLVVSSDARFTQVTVMGLSPPFMKDILVSVIEAHLLKRGELVSGEKAIRHVQEYDAMKGTVVVEFINDKLAQAACKLEDVVYLTDKVTLLMVQTDLKSSEPLVTVSKISPPFIENVLVSIIEAHLLKRGELVSGEKAIRHVQEYDAIKGTVVVEFINDKLAQAACTLEDVVYITDKVTLLMAQTDLNKKKIPQNPMSPIVSPEPDRSSEILLSLDSPRATLAFLQECVVEKGDWKGPFRGTEAVFKKIAIALDENHNICVSIDACKTKKKRLDELHRRNPNHEWLAYMAFLRGETCVKPWNDESTASSVDSNVLAATKFVKGAVMSHAAVLSLIDIWLDHKEEYLKPHKDAPFYREVSTQMVLRGHYFSPEQCKNKMADLLSAFKEYMNSLKRTGTGRQLWRYYEPLRPILDDLVTVEAQQTYSVGAAVVATQNERLKSLSPAESDRTGKQRPSPTSAKDEKKAMLQMLINSRQDFMQELKEIAGVFQQFRKEDGNNNFK